MVILSRIRRVGTEAIQVCLPAVSRRITKMDVELRRHMRVQYMRVLGCVAGYGLHCLQ